MNFFNKELKEFLRDKEVKPYSVDVFPEEAKRIVPKIKKMMSIENFSKLKNFPSWTFMKLVGLLRKCETIRWPGMIKLEFAFS